MKNRIDARLISFILIIYTLLCQTIILSSAEESLPALSENVEVGSRFWELFFGEDDNGAEDTTLLVGGGVFGVKLKQKYLTVVDSKGIPALKNGDLILSVNGKEVYTISDFKNIVESSGGNSLTIRALHDGHEIAAEIRPSLVDGEYKIGIGLRDGAAGLGTITFIDPETGVFGGLGHGICDADSGEKENNFCRNERSRGAAKIFCELCPVPVTFLGWEIGYGVITGGSLPETDHLKVALNDHGSNNGRHSWDPMTALMAIIGDEKKAGYDTVRGYASVDETDGANHFKEDANGTHAYVTMRLPKEYYANEINSFIGFIAPIEN